jgi:CBS domain-containing protein
MVTTDYVGRYYWLRVADLMTEAPFTVNPSETVGDAEKILSTKGIRHLPVVEGKALVGMVTDRDIRSFLSEQFPTDPETKEKLLQTPVRALMTCQPITLAPDDNIEKVLEIFISEKVGGIPVVDSAAGLVGIVTYIDLLKRFLYRIQED